MGDRGDTALIARQDVVEHGFGAVAGPILRLLWSVNRVRSARIEERALAFPDAIEFRVAFDSAAWTGR